MQVLVVAVVVAMVLFDLAIVALVIAGSERLLLKITERLDFDGFWWSFTSLLGVLLMFVVAGSVILGLILSTGFLADALWGVAG